MMSKAKIVQWLFLGVTNIWLFKTSLRPPSFYRGSLNLQPSWAPSWSQPALQCSQGGITQADTCQLLSAFVSSSNTKSPSRMRQQPWDFPEPEADVSQSGLPALSLLCSSISCSLLSVCPWDSLSPEASLWSHPQAQPEPQASSRSCSSSSGCTAQWQLAHGPGSPSQPPWSPASQHLHWLGYSAVLCTWHLLRTLEKTALVGIWIHP